MPRPYSTDLRERAVEAVESGASRREIAEIFKVGVSSVIRWCQRWSETGSAAPKRSGGSVSPLEEHSDWILALVAKQPDLTLEEILAAMAKQGIPGSRSALQRFFDRHNVSFKKSLHAAEQKRADVARARRRWIREQGMLDPARLVFIDETATSTNMVRLRGRCPRGERLIASVPHGHWKTITFVAGLRHDGIVAPFVIDGAMNGPIFLAYIEQCLAPTLGRRDIVIMDNLPAHKVAGVIEAIEALGASVLYLPSYSPDLNPIEQFFSKLKALLRQAAERTIPNLWRRIRLLLRTVCPEECANFLRHAGYVST